MGAETKRPEAVRPLELDVAQPRSVTAAVCAVRQDFDQHIDCLVNNGESGRAIAACMRLCADGGSSGEGAAEPPLPDMLP